MPSVTIVVFNGKRTEMLPELCMFCGQSVEDERYVEVPTRVGKNVGPSIMLPICMRDRSHLRELVADGRNAGFNLDNAPEALATVLGELGGVGGALVGAAAGGLAVYLMTRKTDRKSAFTIPDVHPTFVQELNRLRKLTPQEYEQMMTAANAKFLAKLQAGVDTAGEAESQARKEQQLAEDETTFALADAKGKGTVSHEVSTASSTKFLIAAGVVAVISVLLLICMSAGVVGLIYMNKPSEPEVGGENKKNAEKPKEQQAKIKAIDGDQQSIKFLVPVGKVAVTRVYNYSDATTFYNKAGERLPGVAALVMDEYCVILPTDDGKGLQWLKLTDAP